MNQLSTVLALAMLVVVVALPVLRPRLALVTWFMQHPLEQVLQGNIQWFLTNDLFVNMAVLGSVGVAAGRVLLTEPRMHAQMRNGALWCVLYILVYAGTSVLWSLDKKLAVETIRLTLPYGAVAVLLVPLTLHTLDDLRRARWWFLLFGCFLAVAVFTSDAFKFYGTRALVQLAGNVRGNPLIIAEVGGLMFLLGSLSRDSGGWGVGSLLRITAMILGMGMCLASGSRGQFIASVIATFLVFPFARPVRNVGAIASTVIGVPLLMVLLFYSMRLFVGLENFNRWTGTSLSAGVEDRFMFVRRYLEAWALSPFGWIAGFGTFSFPVIGGGLAGFVENFVVEILIEEGIPTFLVFVLGVYFAASTMLRFALARTTRDDDRLETMTMVAMLAFYFIVGVKSYNVWTAYPFWLWMIVGVKLVRETALQRQDEAELEAAAAQADSMAPHDHQPATA